MSLRGRKFEVLAAFARAAKPSREEMAAQMAQVALGHTEHCAARIAWGDGECECARRGIRIVEER